MYVNVNELAKRWEQWDKRVPLRYDKPLKSLTGNCPWQRVGMDISYMPKTEDEYHLLVVAREYYSVWEEARPQKPSTSEKVAYFFDVVVICRSRTPESLVLDGGAEKNKWTDLLLKCYNVRKITVTTYQATANGVIEREHRPIADALFKLTACSHKRKEM